MRQSVTKKIRTHMNTNAHQMMNGIYGAVGDTNILQPNHDEWLSCWIQNASRSIFDLLLHFRSHSPPKKLTTNSNKGFFRRCVFGFISAFVFIYISFSCSIMAYNDRINWFFRLWFLSLSFFPFVAIVIVSTFFIVLVFVCICDHVSVRFSLAFNCCILTVHSDWL